MEEIEKLEALGIDVKSKLFISKKGINYCGINVFFFQVHTPKQNTK